VLSLGSIWHEREWSHDLLGCLQQVPERLGNVLAGKRAANQRYLAPGLEQRLADVCASALRTPIDHADGIVPELHQSFGEQLRAGHLERDRLRAELMIARAETAEYRERLAHLVRVHAVGEMSASIAHEINQPLVAIENYALAARRRLADGAAVDTGKLDELLTKIGAQAARAGAVMHRLRAMMKKHEPQARPIDLGRLVSDTMKLMEMASQSLGLRVEMAIAADLPHVLADDIQIQQVLLNLARNAIEAMEAACMARKELSIVAQRAGASELLVRVTDTGPGVAPADVQHLFEAFYSTKASGLGVGLAISRAIVEAHGGRLGYVANPGGGAAFEFTLPVATGEVR